MRQRVFLIAAVLASGALAACGGASGTNSGSIPNPTASPATPKTVVLSGTKNVQAVYAFPAASPYPNENLTSAISESTTSSAPAAGTTQYTTTELETLPTVQHTYTTVENVTQDAGPNGTQNFLINTNNYTDDSNDSQQIAYAPSLIVDEEPENNGATWTNGAGLVDNEKYADGTTDTRTQSANGSYTDALVSPDGTNATITVNADGSGGISTPAASPSLFGGAVISYAFSAPSAAPSAGGQITISIDYNPLLGITPNPFVEQGNAWFAPISASNPLYSDVSKISTGTAIPASCNVPAAYGSTATDVQRNVKSLDPTLGFEETTRTDTYVNPTLGPLCVAMLDTVVTYYDFQGTNTLGSHNFLTGLPLQTTTTTQTLALQSGTGAGIQGLLALSPATIAGAQANFNASISAQRMKRTAAFIQYIRTLRANGGTK